MIIKEIMVKVLRFLFNRGVLDIYFFGPLIHDLLRLELKNAHSDRNGVFSLLWLMV